MRELYKSSVRLHLIWTCWQNSSQRVTCCQVLCSQPCSLPCLVFHYSPTLLLMELHPLNLKWTCQIQTPLSKIKRELWGVLAVRSRGRIAQKRQNSQRKHLHVTSHLCMILFSVFNVLHIHLLCSLSCSVWHNLRYFFLSTSSLVNDLWPEASLRQTSVLHCLQVTGPVWSRLRLWSTITPEAAAQLPVWMQDGADKELL